MQSHNTKYTVSRKERNGAKDATAIPRCVPCTAVSPREMISCYWLALFHAKKASISFTERTQLSKDAIVNTSLRLLLRRVK